MGKRMEGVEESGRKEQRKRKINMLKLDGRHVELERVLARRRKTKERRYVE
jgi:hypothetical protein